MNVVHLLGRITRDIELRHTPSNTAVADVGLAMNRKWKTPEGEQREEVTFVDCVAFGRTAEVIAQYFAKGKPILIEGRLKLDTWDDKTTGQKRSKLGVIVERFHFCGGGKTDDEGGETPAQRSSLATVSTSLPPRGRQPEPMGEDDIPF